jgi:hypothetical protein
MLNYKLKILFIILGSFIFNNAWAYVDFSANFFYTKEIFGENDNVNRSRNYNVTWAWYMFSTTALELNYSEAQSTYQNNDDVTVATNVVIKQSINQVFTDSYSIGIRQSFAPRTSRFIPSISASWSNQKQEGFNTYTIDNNGTVTDLKETTGIVEQSSMSAAVMLTIKFTQFFGMNFMGRKFFPKDDTIKESAQFSAGINWLF